MSTDGASITRDDIEASFRELNGEVGSEVDAARPQFLTLGAAVAVGVIALAFLAGRRRGRKRSAVVEVRRI
ncbi:MAG TPA: hypothetical protein VHY77_05540 [Acidimicrobiales bacterium]|jgi:hypothetical protein|nr:hypothetical protein [Acidimicrobiales bacterium]